MKRTLLAGTFHLLAGAFTLLLVASIFYSCRSGGDPHHSGSAAALDGPPAETTRSAEAPQAATEAMNLTLADVQLPGNRSSAAASEEASSSL